MIWRFRREIILIICTFFSFLIIKKSYFNNINQIENKNSIEEKLNYKELVSENIRLREILDIKNKRGYFAKFKAGTIISLKPHIFPAELIIDKGDIDGFKEGMSVISKDTFLIGRVSKVENAASKVITIFNSASKISVVVDSTKEVGIMEGGNVPYCSLKYITQESKIKKGDKVFTSGYSGLYLKGIEIGEVVKISKMQNSLFFDIDIKPYGCLTCMDEVLVGE